MANVRFDGATATITSRVSAVMQFGRRRCTSKETRKREGKDQVRRSRDSHVKRLLVGSELAKHSADSSCLDWIAHWGSGSCIRAVTRPFVSKSTSFLLFFFLLFFFLVSIGQLTVSLDISRLGKGQIRLPIDVLDEILLGLLAGLRDDGSVSILIRARGTDHSANHVAISHSGRDRLQDNGNDALASGIAVGPLVKAVRPAVRRQEVLMGQEVENGRVQQQVRTSDERLSCMRYNQPFCRS